jgi:AmiR/NasT family two-component response regulator
MPMRVVIADDEWLIAAAMRRQIESYGHTVVGTASTGKEALRLCRAESPDLVLMDVQMPDMDGIEATRRLMEQGPVCVVIVTGKGQFDQTAAQAGAMGYVTKPLLTNQIPAVMDSALQRFDRFMTVYRSSSSSQEALQAWLAVRQAVAELTSSVAASEEDAFAQVERMARRRRLSLPEAAGLIVASGRVGATALSC